MRALAPLSGSARLVAALLAAASFSPGAHPVGDVSGDWNRARRLVFPVEYANVDIVPLGDGRFRAYLMSFGGVISAISADGRTFALEEGVRLPSGEHHALVRLPDGRVRMYYSRSGPSDPDDPSSGVLSALSSDGLTFEPDPGVRLRPGADGEPDDAGIIHPHVIEVRGGGYRMYYDADAGARPGNDDAPNWKGIRSATSSDGLEWSKDRGFRIRKGMQGLSWADLVWSPFAQRRGKRTIIYFGAETDENPRRRAGIYRATSLDGLAFTVEERELGIDPDVERPEQGPGGMTGLPQDPFIIQVGSGERLFFWQAQEGTFSAFRRIG